MKDHCRSNNQLFIISTYLIAVSLHWFYSRACTGYICFGLNEKGVRHKRTPFLFFAASNAGIIVVFIYSASTGASSTLQITVFAPVVNDK